MIVPIQLDPLNHFFIGTFKRQAITLVGLDLKLEFRHHFRALAVPCA